MEKSDKVWTTAYMIVMAIVFLWRIEILATQCKDLRESAIKYNYAEKVIENDQIVFKWKIPASATAELK